MNRIIRTNHENSDFKTLVKALNSELAIIDGEDHDFYMQFNGIENLDHVIVIFNGDLAVSCGAMKIFNDKKMEIKRMYTLKDYRSRGLAGTVLKSLENWAEELGFQYCVLETGKRQLDAVNLYKKWGYDIIQNYGPYKGVANSLCFQKELNKKVIRDGA